MDSVVLLLNSDYEPLNVCNVRRAFRLVFGEKAEVIQYDHHEVRTPTEIFRAPSVIRLHHRVKRPRPRVRLSRREIFVRDKHTCQYCGAQTHDLTLDHIIPAAPRRRAHLGQPRRRLQALQPPQGRPAGRRSAHAPAAPAVRAALRRLHAVHALSRGPAQRGLAGLPLHRAELGRAQAQCSRRHRLDVPADVRHVLDTLWSSGHAAYVVGGGVRDSLLARAVSGLGCRHRRAARATARGFSEGAIREPLRNRDRARRPPTPAPRSRPFGATTSTPITDGRTR